MTSPKTLAAALLLACAAAVPAHAAVTHEQAFDLCVAQPGLQTENVREIYDDIMSKPHPPGLDDAPAEKFINALQYEEGNMCAAKMVAHPDVFATIVLAEPTTSDAWKIAWVSFNTNCKSTLTGKCISGEIEGAAAIREMTPDGPTPASRDCQLVLAEHTGFAPWKRCMDVVGDQHPEESVIRSCSFSVGWHSQKDAGVAGKKILACYAKAK